MAMLLRRVRRAAWKYGAKPQVIAATATVGNPRELAEELCATDFALIDRATSARGQRTAILWRPEELDPGACSDDALTLFRRALLSGLQTILFTRSRKQVEELVLRLERDTGKSRGQLKVRAYRGGYGRDEREVIEEDLREGRVRGVVTTNALEVGVDIGSLDVCISAGNPGTLMALRQQMGRVGRRDRASAAFLVASSNGGPERERGHRTAQPGDHRPPRRGGRIRVRSIREGARSTGWRSRARSRQGDGRARSRVVERFRRTSPAQRTKGCLGGHGPAFHHRTMEVHQTRTFRVRLLEQRRIYLDDEPSGGSTRALGTRTVAYAEARRMVELVPGVRASLGNIDVVDRYEEYLEFGPPERPRRQPIHPPSEARMRTDGLVITVDEESVQRMTQGRNVDLALALHGLVSVLSLK